MKAFLLDCEKDYVSGDKDEDITSMGNTVETYRLAQFQRKYVHMYAAKSVACWIYLRRVLAVEDGCPIVSIGAGPCTCLIGWFFDRKPETAQVVRAFDVLSWKFIRDLPSHQALMADVLGPDADFVYEPFRYFPASLPPQAEVVGSPSPINAADLPDGAVVLLPYVLNHLLGRTSPVVNPGEVLAWLEDVRLGSRLVVIVDMPCNVTDVVWKALAQGLDIGGSASVIESDRITGFQSAYSERANWPWRRTSHHMNASTVLVGDYTGWRFLAQEQRLAATA